METIGLFDAKAGSLQQLFRIMERIINVLDVAVTCTCSAAAQKAEFLNCMGLIPVAGNSSRWVDCVTNPAREEEPD